VGSGPADRAAARGSEAVCRRALHHSISSRRPRRHTVVASESDASVAPAAPAGIARGPVLQYRTGVHAALPVTLETLTHVIYAL